jgi:hypothetical protein
VQRVVGILPACQSAPTANDHHALGSGGSNCQPGQPLPYVKRYDARALITSPCGRACIGNDTGVQQVGHCPSPDAQVSLNAIRFEEALRSAT